jgi:ribonuclease P protein component
MLPKKHKFSSKDFEKLPEFTASKAVFPFGLVVFLKPEVQKAAIVISKKYVKNAPERNLVKRIFFKHLQDTGKFVVIFIKKKIDPLQFKDELGKLNPTQQ